ncbi:unnamed protein product, partial [Amoebophrya sp. A120]|eukprot:GSA120T00015582001.1
MTKNKRPPRPQQGTNKADYHAATNPDAETKTGEPHHGEQEVSSPSSDLQNENDKDDPEVLNPPAPPVVHLEDAQFDELFHYLVERGELGDILLEAASSTAAGTTSASSTSSTSPLSEEQDLFEKKLVHFLQSPIELHLNRAEVL